jgi:hypothetical protein
MSGATFTAGTITEQRVREIAAEEAAKAAAPRTRPYSAPEAAEALNCSTLTIYRHVQAGILPRLPQRPMRIPAKAIHKAQEGR